MRLPRTLPLLTYAIPDALKREVREGSVVTIMVRGRRRAGCVWRVHDTRSPGMAIQSIVDVSSLLALSAPYRTMCAWVARDTAVHLGTLLHDIVPTSPARTRPRDTRVARHDEQLQLASVSRGRSLIIVGDTAARFTFYRRRMTEARKTKRQLLLLFPTHERLEFFLSSLSGAVRKSCVIYHAQLAKGAFFQAWTQVSAGAPIVIGTRSAVFAPGRWDEIIIDSEEDRSYKQEDQNPRYRVHRVVAYLERAHGARVTYVSSTPRVTTWARVPASRLRTEDERRCMVRALDMRGAPVVHAIFHEQFLAAMQEAVHRGTYCVLLVPRKGFAGSVLCRDCGYTFACTTCGRLMGVTSSFGQSGSSYSVQCSICGTRARVPDVCPRCKGAVLDFSGVGVQKLETIIRTALPTMPRSRVLVTHEPPERVDGTIEFLGIVSCESLLHVPDMGADERTYVWLESIRSFGDRQKLSTLTLQSWTPEHAVVRAFVRHTPDIFYAEALRERRQRQFPPYARTALVFVKTNNVATGMRQCEVLRLRLEKTIMRDAGILIEGPFVRRSPSRGTVSATLFLRQPIGCPEVSFTDVLKSVPDPWLVDREPESIF
ncbi:hypothetical protein HY629_02575 [Candidatus Uhrbacteria bacterium]|nr:hypothetical protein [Candidatus Uhrbacteria bacterium]